MRSIDKQWFLVAAAAAILGITACSSDPAFESKGKRASTLGAPKATVLAPASAETTAKYGIVQWKIYRSKSDLMMTGYDVNGKAVKGITTGLQIGADETQVITKLNDGSQFKAVHGLVSESALATSSTIPIDSSEFAKLALADVQAANVQFNAKLATTPTAASAACGADLSAVLTQALSCMTGKQKTKAVQAACIATAKKAAESSEACKNTGTTNSASSSTSSSSSSTSGGAGSSTSSSSSSGEGGSSTSSSSSSSSGEDESSTSSSSSSSSGEDESSTSSSSSGETPAEEEPTPQQPFGGTDLDADPNTGEVEQAPDSGGEDTVGADVPFDE